MFTAPGKAQSLPAHSAHPSANASNPWPNSAWSALHHNNCLHRPLPHPQTWALGPGQLNRRRQRCMCLRPTPWPIQSAGPTRRPTEPTKRHTERRHRCLDQTWPMVVSPGQRSHSYARPHPGHWAHALACVSTMYKLSNTRCERALGEHLGGRHNRESTALPVAGMPTTNVAASWPLPNANPATGVE